jgi:hypothetical protein
MTYARELCEEAPIGTLLAKEWSVPAARWTRSKEVLAMSQRESTLLWLKDTLDHLTGCQKQLEWAADPESVQVLTESMLRDLECCRQLCAALHERHRLQNA